jgi:hypothetical protein
MRAMMIPPSKYAMGEKCLQCLITNCTVCIVGWGLTLVASAFFMIVMLMVVTHCKKEITTGDEGGEQGGVTPGVIAAGIRRWFSIKRHAAMEEQP